MNGSVYVGKKALSLTEYEKTAPISGVILWVDDDNCYEAGDETGTVIEQDCPYATQEMANNLLATLKGYSYQGLEANGAKVSPVAELGDGLTIGGLYTQLAYQNIRFSTGEVMDVAAPGSDETLHEYKTEGQTTKQFTHQIAETKSLISKTSEEILLQVENELEGLSSSFSVQLDNITGRVNGLDGEFAELSLTLDGLTVTDSTGKTVINGSMIQTSNLYVNAANISGTLQANQINLTGAITWGDLDSDVEDRINDAYNTAHDNQLPDYIKSTYIDSTRIESPEIYGGEIYSVDGSGAYAKMESNAFSMMYSGSSVPRAVLQVSNTEATLVLGVGSGTSQDAGRFFITKSSIGGGAAAILYMLGGYDSVGMAFTNNGEIIFNANKVSGLYMEFE